MNFDLRSHIREALAATNDENLPSLVDQIFASIPRKNHADALHQALTEVVRRELATSPRLGQTRSDDQSFSAEPGTNSDGEAAKMATSPTTLPPLPVGNIRNSRAAIFRRNRFRISVWIGGGIYRQILDCTRDELEFAAAESERQAEANRATAVRYRKLTKKMAERDADTVADLTDAEIEEALRDE